MFGFAVCALSCCLMFLLFASSFFIFKTTTALSQPPLSPLPTTRTKNNWKFYWNLLHYGWRAKQIQIVYSKFWMLWSWKCSCVGIFMAHQRNEFFTCLNRMNKNEKKSVFSLFRTWFFEEKTEEVRQKRIAEK